jgi:radical SAM protein
MTGGDPLMRSDFFDLVEYAKDGGLYVAVAASVTPLLDEAAIERMHLLDVDVMSVSVDGATAATHDKLRGVPGTFKKTVDALQLSRKFGLKAQINTTVMRSNIEELPAIFNLVRTTGAVAWEVFFLIRTGRGASLENLEPYECEEVMHFLFDASQYGIPVRTAEGPQFRRVHIQRMNHEVSPQGTLYRRLEANLNAAAGPPTSTPMTKLTQTGDGKGIVFITHDGEIYPSGFLPISTGRLTKKNLTSIYRSHPLFVSLRDPSNLKGRCGRCQFRGICGGSRSRAFCEYGDPFQEDPACSFVP